jgi:hypothetical protein
MVLCILRIKYVVHYNMFFNTLIFVVMILDHLTCAICFDETLILTCDIMTHLVNQMLSIEHFKWSKVVCVL